MGVYNDATRVERAARSILNQTTRDVELIAVNDGSTDGSAAVLDRLARGDPRMRVIHQENAGLTRALIRGCEQARGEFVARQDSGDYSEPERLSRQCAALEASGSTVLTACGAVYVDGGGKEHRLTRARWQHQELAPDAGVVALVDLLQGLLLIVAELDHYRTASSPRSSDSRPSTAARISSIGL